MIINISCTVLGNATLTTNNCRQSGKSCCLKASSGKRGLRAFLFALKLLRGPLATFFKSTKKIQPPRNSLDQQSSSVSNHSHTYKTIISSPEHQTHTQRLQSQHLPNLRSDYNFCADLVERRKFEEAEPALRKLLVELEGRPKGREKGEFLLQEAGTLSLLERVLMELGRGEGNVGGSGKGGLSMMFGLVDCFDCLFRHVARLGTRYRSHASHRFPRR